MAWLLLFLAGVLEVIWSYAMKQSAGFTKIDASIVTVVLLSISMKTLPLGTAYTIWTGIGAIGAFIVGIFVLGEPAHLTRLIAAGFIVIGILMMKLSA